MQIREKIGKLQKIIFFPIIWGRVENRLAKAAGAEPAGQMRNEKVYVIVVRNTFRN